MHQVQLESRFEVNEAAEGGLHSPAEVGDVHCKLC